METRRDLFAFLDGEVSVERNLEVLQHLNACPPCGRRFEAEKVCEAATARALREEPAPAALRGRLARALDAADRGVAPAARPGAPRRLLRLPGGRGGALVAAALLLAAVVAASDYACLGPFRCPVILASVEAADGLAEGSASGGPAPLADAPDLAGRGWRKSACAAAVPAPALGLRACVADYEGPGGRASLVTLPTGDHAPKSWNRVLRPDGSVWYEAVSDGRRVLGWREGGVFRALVTRSDALDLAALAAEIRRGR
jgi:anti-sigma factor (TIGR02949 family)